MAGAKGKSGPPGNMNSATSIIPALRRLRLGKPLPPELVRVAAIADQEVELLVGDKGGLDNLTGGERLMLNVWRTARQATLLILYEMAERGAIVATDGSWDLQPGAARLAKFLAEERAVLIALKFDERRSRDVTDLARAIQEAQREEDEESHEG